MKHHTMKDVVYLLNLKKRDIMKRTNANIKTIFIHQYFLARIDVPF